ncbi:hypothetical protein AB4E05_16025, partial [Clostridioides difficile]
EVGIRVAFIVLVGLEMGIGVRSFIIVIEFYTLLIALALALALALKKFNILPQLSELYFKYTFQFISFVLFFLISHY